jgi:hypothetical protein
MIRKKNELISILFIGNSFSYYHSLPKLIAHFAQVSGSGNLVVEGVFRGGGTLKMLWEDGEAIKKLRSKKWDYVVLQERGRLGGIIKNGVVHVGKPQEFIKFITRFDKEIKKINAKTILYCPPAFLGIGQPDDAKKLEIIYAKLARKLGVIIIPSETAFILALKKRPSVNPYERDGHHPNPVGIYLVATLFYKKIFGENAKKLSLTSYSSRSQKLPKKPKIVKLSKSQAQFLWSIADQTK